MLKKIALAAMIGAALISVAGCGSSDKKSNGAASGSKNVTIGFSVSTLNSPHAHYGSSDSARWDMAGQSPAHAPKQLADTFSFTPMVKPWRYRCAMA